MRKWTIWLIVGVVALAVLVGFGIYTERSEFCNSCHEMEPYYAAWLESPHAEVACVDCHVDYGLFNRIAHKPVALLEVWYHITTDPMFPQYPTDVPDRRCVRCHETVEVQGVAGFSHEEHAADGPCQYCHPSTGHEVTFEALAEAESLDEQVAQEATRPVAGILNSAVPNPQPLPGHDRVSCSDCHDMVERDCDYCHEPPSEDHFPDQACRDCHDPQDDFDEAEAPEDGDGSPDEGEGATGEGGESEETSPSP